MNISGGFLPSLPVYFPGCRAAVFILALSLNGVGALRADLLTNENFKEGKVHWKGDVQDLPAPLGQNAPSGGLIKLKKDQWTTIFQVYKSPGKPVVCSVTYQLSADFKVVGKKEAPLGDWGMMPGDKLYFIVRQGFGGSGSSIEIPPERSTPVVYKQTITKDAGEVLVCFCVPPGEGTVTFTNFSATVDTAAK